MSTNNFSPLRSPGHKPSKQRSNDALAMSMASFGSRNGVLKDSASNKYSSGLLAATCDRCRDALCTVSCLACGGSNLEALKFCAECDKIVH
jgi:hypothetical protein